MEKKNEDGNFVEGVLNEWDLPVNGYTNNVQKKKTNEDEYQSLSIKKKKRKKLTL